MNKLHSLYNFFGSHKYLVTSVIILVIVGFVDENSLWNRHKRQSDIDALKLEISFYKDKFDDDTRRLNALNNYKNVVTLARERYYMKRSDEDLFVFVQPELEEAANDSLAYQQ